MLQAQVGGFSSSLHERLHSIDEHTLKLLAYVDHSKLSDQPIQNQDLTLVFRDDDLVALQRALHLQQQIRVIRELQTPPPRNLPERQKVTGAYMCMCY